MDWARILAHVTGSVDQELLARNECLAIVNCICMAQLNVRPRLSDAPRGVLGEVGQGGVPVEGDPVRRALLAAGSCATIIARRRDGASVGPEF
jgi:hypothetical protein